VSPRVKLKADCASDVGGNVITVHKDCRLCCVSLAFNMPAGWYAMLVERREARRGEREWQGQW